MCIPDDLLPDAEHAFLYIDGGSTPRNPNSPPTDIEFVITKLCRGSKTIGAVLHQIPNQPVYFTGDPTRGRSEDAMIAYTWSHFVNNTLEPDWLARMPMTKASIRAIDTIQDFAQSLGTIKVPTKFVVGGASKRGTLAIISTLSLAITSLMNNSNNNDNNDDNNSVVIICIRPMLFHY